MVSRAVVPDLDIDYSIPYMEIFVIPYIFGFYGFLFLSCLFYVLSDDEFFWRFVYSLIIASSIAFTIFLLYPTKIVLRPKTMPNTFLSRLMSKYYIRDVEANSLPSAHTFFSWVISLNLMRDLKNVKVKISALLMAIAVSLSTLFVRQHYVLDVIAGIVVGFVSFIVASKFARTSKDFELLVVPPLRYLPVSLTLLYVLLILFLLI